MAELNAGVNRYVVDQAGDNGKTAFTQEAPTATGFGESTHHFEKTTGDMGIFVYSDDVTSIKVWQKISGSWVDCGSTGAIGGINSWNLSFAWRENATHMHLQLDGPNNAVEAVRIIRVEDNMFASFDGTGRKETLLLNDAVVSDTDGDGDIEIVSGIGYRVVELETRDLSLDLATNTLFEWNVDAQAAGGVLILNDTEVLPVTVKTAFNGTVTTFEGTKADGTGWARTDVVTFYFEEGSSYSGNVSDGAISGATVTDIATGATATTDANGDFTFAVKPAGDIEATGGIDIVTGDAYVGRLKGNSKYTIISPLSTAAVEVAADSGVTFDQAVDNILDNSAFLFGIDFPKEDKLELLNKRFIDEAAAGNSKALRGAALVALIDTSAEVVGEALTHMSDTVAGNLATDADDGKREAYKGIARLVREALTTDEETKNNATSPLIASVERISTNVALNKGASRVEIEMQNERGSNYRSDIGSLIEERALDFRSAIEPNLDENYSITRVQSIAKTTRNEDITAIEAFKGREGVDTLNTATVVNTNINQIGSVPNTITEEVKYTEQELENITKIELVDSAGRESDANANGRLDRNNVTKFGYFKEFGVGSQLLISMSTTERDAYVEFNLSQQAALAFELALGVKYYSLKITTRDYAYTINYRGIVESREKVVAASGLTDWSNTEVLELSLGGDAAGVAGVAGAAGAAATTEQILIVNEGEFSKDPVEVGTLRYTLSERWKVIDSGATHKTRGKEYQLTQDNGQDFDSARGGTYALYDGDMNNLYATVMKEEILVPIVITNGEATFDVGNSKDLTELSRLKVRKKGSGDMVKGEIDPGLAAPVDPNAKEQGATLDPEAGETPLRRP